MTARAAGHPGIVRGWPGALLAVSLLMAAGCSKRASEAAAKPSPGSEARAAPPPGLEYVPPEPGTYGLPPIQPAPDGAVVDESKRLRRLHDYMGDRYVLLSFVYTRCSMARGCPLATGVLQMVRDRARREPGLARSFRVVTLSFDPERDTPEVMEHYAETLGKEGGPELEAWTFLTTASKADLAPILEGYGQYIVPERDESGKWTGDFSHVLKVFLIDRNKRVRQIYSSSFLHPAIVLNDVRTLMMEDAGG